jgi:DNA-binding NarL/FixJ family response regulator
LSQNAIASELYISPKTVATHIQHILTKLDVHSHAEAVASAYRLEPREPGRHRSHTGLTEAG